MIIICNVMSAVLNELRFEVINMVVQETMYTKFAFGFFSFPIDKLHDQGYERQCPVYEILDL